MGVSPKQFAAMEARLSGRAPSASGGSPVLPESGLHLPEGSRVLGIDPSLRGTGWGVIRIGAQGPTFVEAGTIHCPKSWERSRCLGEIGRILTEVVQRHPRPSAPAKAFSSPKISRQPSSWERLVGPHSPLWHERESKSMRSPRGK